MSNKISHKYTSFGEALSKSLDIIGLSQNEFAEKVGKDHAQVSRWVNNKVIPHNKTLRHINNVTKCDISKQEGDWVVKPSAELLLDSYESRVVDEGISYTAQSQLIEFLQSRLKSLAKESLEIAQMLESLRKPS